MQQTALLSLVQLALEKLKARNIVTLEVGELTDLTDTMIIASGTSSRHVISLAEHVHLEAKKAGYEILGVEGTDDAEWVLVDLNDVIVHVMQEPTREFYDLESLWGGVGSSASLS